MNSGQASGSNGGAPAQPRQRVRARRGQATDPHSIAERVRNSVNFVGFVGNSVVVVVGSIFGFVALIICFLFAFVQLRRERIAERMKALQELVPNANKVFFLFFSAY